MHNLFFKLCLTLGLAAAGTAVTACDSPAVSAPRGTTLITASQSEHLTVVDVETGRIIARPGPISGIGEVALSADSTTLYLTVHRELLALDMHSLRFRWRERTKIIDSAANVAAGFRGLAISPDGARIFLDSENDGVPGIAVLDSRTREEIAFSGPFTVADLAMIPAGPAAAGGALLVTGSRAIAGRSADGKLFVLDPATLAVRDSVLLVPSGTNRWGDVGQVLPSPDGRHVYVGAASGIVRYDVLERRVVNRVALPYRAPLAIAPDGRRLYMPNQGDGRNWSGNGLLYVFDADLTPRTPIDLSAAEVPGAQPIQLNLAVVSHDSRRVYVSAGTAHRGPLYGPHPGRVLVVDAVTGQLLREIPTGDWLTRKIVLR
jgi:DNA-binding beta-propeller fold protein YncE